VGRRNLVVSLQGKKLFLLEGHFVGGERVRREKGLKKKAGDQRRRFPGGVLKIA